MNWFFLDFIMAGLLIAVIYYSIHLSQKIDTLNEIRAEITPIIGNLTAIMNQASANVMRLKTLSNNINASLAISVPKAEALKDDLTFLFDHGERLAQRLDNTIDEARMHLNKIQNGAPLLPDEKKVRKLETVFVVKNVDQPSEKNYWERFNTLKDAQ